MPIELADYHRIAYLMGCESLDDVIQWADEEIARLDNPELELINISLGQSLSMDQIDSNLQMLVKDSNDSSSLKAVLNQISMQVKNQLLSVEDAIDRIFKYSKRNGYYDELHLCFISLADYLWRIRNGMFVSEDVYLLRQALLDEIDDFCKSDDGC